MANSRFYLDERKTKAGCSCVLKIGIAHKGMSAFISLDVKIFPFYFKNLTNLPIG